MKYKYVPDLYNWEFLIQKKISYDEFLQMQIEYRKTFEKMLKQLYNFSQIDSFLNEKGYNKIQMEMDDFNFYHKFSTLESKYVVLRNNYHIEKLDDNEFNELYDAVKNNKKIEYDFIRNTYPKVLYEDEEFICFGPSIPKNVVNGKGLIFEFIYDVAKCSDEKEIEDILNQFNDIFEKLSANLKKYLDVNYSKLVFDGTFNSIFRD